MPRICLPTLLVCGAALGSAPAAPLRYSDRDVELTLTAVSDRTVRITLTAKDRGRETRALDDGPVLAPRRWPGPALSVSDLDAGRTAALGNLRVSVMPAPLTVEIRAGGGKLVQRLTFAERDGAVTFHTGGRVLGLGGGGQQFDRRGSFDPMTNGHRAGEYQIFGSRVPVPFLIGTAGWGLFVHRPYRAAKKRPDSFRNQIQRTSGTA